MKYKIGDRVRAVGNVDGLNLQNEIGVIRDIQSNATHEFLIEFDNSFSGVLHSGNDVDYSNKKYWWVSESNLIRLSEIRIFCDGKKVIAKESNSKRRGVVRCSPEDTFDFKIGAKLALERLFDDSKLYNDKVICIKASDTPGYSTVGKIYEIKDGVLTWDNGKKTHRYKSLEEINGRGEAKFIKLVK